MRDEHITLTNGWTTIQFTAKFVENNADILQQEGWRELTPEEAKKIDDNVDNFWEQIYKLNRELNERI